MNKTEQLMGDCEENGKVFDEMKDRVLKRNQLDLGLVRSKLNKCVGKMEKSIQEEKEKKEKKTVSKVVTRPKSYNTNPPGNYEKITLPFPNYAVKHHYETRLSEAHLMKENKSESNESSISEISSSKIGALKGNQKKKQAKKNKEKDGSPKISTIVMNKKEETKRWKY